MGAVPELEAVPVLEAALVPPPRETSLSLVVPRLLSEATKSINQSIETIANKRTMEKQKNCILMIQATSVHNGPEKENNIIDWATSMTFLTCKQTHGKGTRKQRNTRDYLSKGTRLTENNTLTNTLSISISVTMERWWPPLCLWWRYRCLWRRSWWRWNWCFD